MFLEKMKKRQGVNKHCNKSTKFERNRSITCLRQEQTTYRHTEIHKYRRQGFLFRKKNQFFALGEPKMNF